MIRPCVGKAAAILGITLGLVAYFGNGLVGSRRQVNRHYFSSDLRQVALALLQYEHIHGRLPPAVVCDGAGKPLYSWRVLILPWLDGDDIYKNFHLDEPWDSPHNRPVTEAMPASFGPSKKPPAGHPVTTFIQAFIGPGTAFESPEGEPLKSLDGRSNFPDDPSKTLLIVESANPVPWAKPVDLNFDPAGPLPELGGAFAQTPDDPLYRPRHKTYGAAFLDGSVRFLPKIANYKTLLRQVIIRNDGLPLEILAP